MWDYRGVGRADETWRIEKTEKRQGNFASSIRTPSFTQRRGEIPASLAPLSPGAKVNSFFSGHDSADVGRDIEDVTVPAGKSQCSVISFETRLIGTTQSRIWVAKGVGFVKCERVAQTGLRETLELVRYAPGKEAELSGQP